MRDQLSPFLIHGAQGKENTVKGKHLNLQVKLVGCHLHQLRIPSVRCKLCVSRHTHWIHPPVQSHSTLKSQDRDGFLQRKEVTDSGHDFVSPVRDHFHRETSGLLRGKNLENLVLFELMMALKCWKRENGWVTSVTGGETVRSLELDGSWRVDLHFVLCSLQGIIQI